MLGDGLYGYAYEILPLIESVSQENNNVKKYFSISKQ